MVQTHRLKAIAIVGPTAVGKSETALRLARKFGGAIVGADSMQVYRGFDIGTGKLTRDECGDTEHSMIDIVDGDADFSVGEYVELAKREIERITAEGKLPLIVGGTGMYVNSLFSGCNFADAPKDSELRAVLKTAAHFFGAKTMHALLKNIDLASAEKIAANDLKRVIRALEIYTLTSKPKSTAATGEKPFDDLTIVLTLPREELYARINARVKNMFGRGLVEEALSLMKYKKCTSMQALGYKQIAEQPDALQETLIELVAQKTRNYAKRQMTYFNNMKLDKVFIDARNYSEIERTVEDFWERG